MPGGTPLVVRVGQGEQRRPVPFSAVSRPRVSAGQLLWLYRVTVMPIVASDWLSSRPPEVRSGFASIRFSRAAIFRDP